MNFKTYILFAALLIGAVIFYKSNSLNRDIDFSNLIKLKESIIPKKPKKIAVQPYGKIDNNLAIEVKKAIINVYGFETIILPSITLPEEAFTEVKSPRYRADKLIALLKKNRPSEFSNIIGLTVKDISTSKEDKYGKVLEPAWKYEDWGVMGLGYRPGPSCVISTYRIKINNEKLFIERLQKIAVHELGHNLGLKHCDKGEKCVLRDAAETVKTVDRVKLELCDYCIAEIS